MKIRNRDWALVTTQREVNQALRQAPRQLHLAHSDTSTEKSRKIVPSVSALFCAWDHRRVFIL